MKERKKMEKKKIKRNEGKIILYLGPSDVDRAKVMKADLEQRMSLRITWSAFVKHLINKAFEANEVKT